MRRGGAGGGAAWPLWRCAWEPCSAGRDGAYRCFLRGSIGDPPRGPLHTRLPRCCPLAPGLLPRSGLSALHALRQLEALDLGWCGSVHDADAEAISHFSRLQELSLAHTRVGGPRAGARAGPSPPSGPCQPRSGRAWSDRVAGQRRRRGRGGAVPACTAVPAASRPDRGARPLEIPRAEERPAPPPHPTPPHPADWRRRACPPEQPVPVARAQPGGPVCQVRWCRELGGRGTTGRWGGARPTGKRLTKGKDEIKFQKRT